MPELRKDMIRDNWVLIVTNRAMQLEHFPIYKKGVSSDFNDKFCPFCEGNEHYTTDELAAYRKDGSSANAPGWMVRAIPNKFPILGGSSELKLHNEGIYQRLASPGQHEVIIETPLHNTQLHQLGAEHVEMVFKMMKERYSALAAEQRWKYIQIYKNHGLFAGASQGHTHSQILAYPMIADDSPGIRKYYSETGDCLLCKIIGEETRDKSRVIYESPNFLVVCPYAARFCYETWIIPKTHEQRFSDISEEEIRDLSGIYIKFFTALLDTLGNPSYNIMINSAPVNSPGQEEGYHWYIDIAPRILVTNGMELASGYYLNPIAPEDAAQVLKKGFNK